MNVAEELREQAKRVEEGWVRGCPEKPKQACVIAYTDAQGDYHWITVTTETFLRKVMDGNPVDWNDSKPSEGGPVNRRQVAAELRRAADAWEREELSSKGGG